MRALFLRAYFMLMQFDSDVSGNSFAALHEKVRKCAIAERVPTPFTVGQVCSAVDRACVWYRKEVLCLQRSAATTCLLRRHGVPAQLVIGAQQIPFKAHAWVEVDGRVVNDKPYMREMYQVLERC